MKKKKVLALTLVAAMAAGSSLTAWGTEQGTGNESESQATNEVSIEGEGEVNYVNTSIVSVNLPTTEKLKLTIDPQGLSGLADGETASAEDLADWAGLITCADKPMVTNVSSVPVKLTMNLKGTGDAAFVETENAVEAAPTDNDTGENVLLYALPSSQDVKGEDGNYVASTKGVVISKTEAPVSFILDPAEYNYSKDENGDVDYVIKEGDKGHGTAIAFEGKVNTQADWSGYTGENAKTIGMTVVFSFSDELAATDKADAETGAYGMMALSSGTKTIEVASKDVAPSAPGTGTWSATDGGTVTVSLGSGEKAATGYTLTWSKTESGSYATQTEGSSTYTISADKKTITIASGFYGSVTTDGQLYMKIAFDDADKTVKTVVLTRTE